MLERVRVGLVEDVLIDTPRVFTEWYERPKLVKSNTLEGKHQLIGLVFQHLARSLTGAVNFAHLSGDTGFSV